MPTTRTQRPHSAPEPPKPTTDTTDAVAGRWALECRDYPPSPNDRKHWMAKARDMKRWKGIFMVLARQAGIPPCQRIRVSAVIIRRAVGRADEDNDRARLKPCLDSLVAAGVIPDDRRGYIEHGPVTEERGPRGLRLVIERIA